MENKILPIAAFFISLLFINSCKKNNPNITAPAAPGVYITNEGGYANGNGDISFYNPANNEVTNNLFQNINNFKLGDVIQSMYIKDSTGFIVVNNSQKIVVVKIPSFTHIKTIIIPNSSPRYFQPVNDSVAYVTDLYAGKLHIINYKNGTVVKEITQMSKWTEHMVTLGNYVVIEERNLLSNPANTCSIATINTADNTFAQRYSFTGSNINGIAKDNQNRLWLAIDEDTAHSITASIKCLNPDFSLNKNINFAAGHHPSSLCINGNRNKLYFFDTDIERISIDDTIPPSVSFISNNGRNFYGLNIEPVSEDIYVSDALDYVQPSRIYRYDKNGNLLSSFTAGIISCNFIFSNE